jgi:FMN phosphatase YigB (HAD superfamily)
MLKDPIRKKTKRPGGTMRPMAFGAVRAICFDLDNTLWEIEPVLLRAEGILADWLRHRYPRITERFSAEEMLAMRAALSREEPHQAHDLTYLRRETLARLAIAVGYDRDIAHEASPPGTPRVINASRTATCCLRSSN